MTQWEAQVRVKTTNHATQLVKTRVFASSYYTATLLLMQLYGKENLAVMPRQIFSK